MGSVGFVVITIARSQPCCLAGFVRMRAFSCAHMFLIIVLVTTSESRRGCCYGWVILRLVLQLEGAGKGRHVARPLLQLALALSAFTCLVPFHACLLVEGIVSR